MHALPQGAGQRLAPSLLRQSMHALHEAACAAWHGTTSFSPPCPPSSQAHLATPPLEVAATLGHTLVAYQLHIQAGALGRGLPVRPFASHMPPKLCPPPPLLLPLPPQGLCTAADCPYLHVNLSASAPVCKAFLRGYCAAGADCPHKHYTLRMVKEERRLEQQGGAEAEVWPGAARPRKARPRGGAGLWGLERGPCRAHAIRSVKERRLCYVCSKAAFRLCSHP